MDVGVPRCWNGDPAWNPALTPRGGKTSKESLGATGYKQSSKTPYKRPMSSSGLQSVEVMLREPMEIGVLRRTGPRTGKRSENGPERSGQTSSESLGAAGCKRSSTVDCGTPYKRPWSISGRQLDDLVIK
ncbi:jg4844 [Pararge aegeria aegeria]|uniref:Jg4844 protein n=1 Tax=Pararge aegeria aegeria TaxID=348720 RepID=A0A8S4S6X0_9NEOP|nr:jg4844 [Pararge aegeria aegeria]